MIPPVVVLALFAAGMYLLFRFLPVGYFDFLGRRYLALGLSVAAVVISILSVIRFFRAGTSVDPRTPDKASGLVTNGIYRYSRNPMYLAMLLLLLAWGLFLGNAFNTLVAAFFVAYMNKFQIIPEEEALSAKFGKAYQQYLLQVRRWF